MTQRFCPRCGAYWSCDCVLEDLTYTPDSGCEHDWVEAVGVELNEEFSQDETKVYLCRLCGIYAVGERNAEAWR